jgi:hypothetical protein
MSIHAMKLHKCAAGNRKSGSLERATFELLVIRSESGSALVQEVLFEIAWFRCVA